MIRIMIVDDERHIVNHFAMLLEKEKKYSFDIIKAYSGVEALELIRQTSVHIMLLDIKMPKKSGLEVAREVSALWPRTKIIFLTSAECFEYIYEIKDLKNASYLLKMETDEKICDRIYNCVEEILQEQRDSSLILETNRKTVIMKHFLNDNILRDLLYGCSVKEIQDIYRVSRAESLLSFEKPVFLALMQVEKTFRYRKKSNVRDWMDYLETMESSVDEHFHYSLVEADRNLYLWIMQQAEGEEEPSLCFARLRSLLEDFQDRLYQSLHYDTQIILYPWEAEWEELCGVYGKLYDHCHAEGRGQLQSMLIKYDPEAATNQGSGSDRAGEQACDELKYDLNRCDFSEYVRKLEEIRREDCFQGSLRSNLRANTCYMSIAVMLVEFIEQNGLKKEVSEKIALPGLFRLEGYRSWEEAFQFLDKVNRAVFTAVEKNKENKRQKTMRAVKEYIQENLSQNLTLFSISQKVCYNEAYISRIFKQHEGIGIFEYIANQRVAYAKGLLLGTELSIQEIAARSGFNTSQYFSVVFKKKLGTTPAEYRNLHKS